MSVSLLTNRRKKSRGGSVHFDGGQATSVGDANQEFELVGSASIIPNSRIHEEPSSQNTPTPMRTRTVGFNLPPNVETPPLRKATIGETARPQPPRPGKPEVKGDGGPEDNTKGQGNALDTIQAKFTAAKSSRVWDTYVRKAEEEDRDLVEDWDRVIDVTLVFAALFSAISTGFVLESSKNLQPDQAKATVLAIQSLTSAIQSGANGSAAPTADSYDDLFKPTLLTIWVNCLWFLSLGLSISVSLFAMLAKRWCYVFRSKRTGTSHERAMKRQKSWDAIEKWKIELVIEQLPTLMHIALMLFFFGLVVYLVEIHQTTMIVTAALVGLTILLYIILTVLPLWYRNCPMVTPFTRIISAICWYPSQEFRDAITQAWWRFKLKLLSLSVRNLYEGLPNWKELLGATISTLKQAFYLSRAGTTWLWEQLFRLLVVLVSFMEREKPSTESNWVIYGCNNHAIAKTIPRPQLEEDNRLSFSAFAWILNNSTDLKTIKEVLDHIMSFPDVILGSLADSDQLYLFALKAVEHLNRFQHDTAEWRYARHINSSCARLIHLTTRPWLHQSTEFSSRYWDILRLSWRFPQLGDAYMAPEEVEKQVATIKTQVSKSADLALWLEDLAGKVVLGCSGDSSLKICSALGRALLNKATRLRTRHIDAEVHPTLWWIFLNSVITCTNSSWPHIQDEDQPKDSLVVYSHSTLTLSHFRDSRKRQESGIWLAVVGITGMLYAFISFPDHENGPAKETNQDYFLDLINFLRQTLRTQVALDTDPFIGDMPVYNGTEVRLYEFDSLQYGIDAVTSALDSPIYASCSFSSDLRILLEDLSNLKDLKDLLRPKEGQDMDHRRIAEIYKLKARDDNAAGIFLTAGVLSMNAYGFRLGRDCAHTLANFLPDIVFGCPSSDQPTIPALPQGCIGMVPTTNQCAEASDNIARWVWMPFSVPYELQDSLKAKDPTYRRREMLWEPLENIGLLRDPINYHSSYKTYRFFSSNCYTIENPEEERLGEAYRAVGYCLYIKAGLLDRLYSSSMADAHSPNILAWSITFAKHIVELLQFWDAASFDSHEQAYIISSLVKLINTLLGALQRGASLEPTKADQRSATAARSTSADVTDPRGQLEALIKAGVLPVLARPFSSLFRPTSTSIDEPIPDKTEWHNDVALTIERLARTFPGTRAEKNFATVINDTLRDYGRPEWVFKRENETSSSDGDKNHMEDHNNSNPDDFYSDLVIYYETKAPQERKDSTPMLELVKRLRDDMGAQNRQISPQVESPDSVCIDMSQRL